MSDSGETTVPSVVPTGAFSGRQKYGVIPMTTATAPTAAPSTITVREIALQTPDAMRVFEKLGIDYCCGGHRPLTEAAAEANLTVNEVMRAIEHAKQDTAARTVTIDWRNESLTALVEHINATHHIFV